MKTSWLLIIAIIVLILSVTALIIVFSVEHSWFHDSFNQTTNYFNYYGLWRLCFYANKTCDSWFSANGPNSQYIYDRLNYSKDEKNMNKNFKKRKKNCRFFFRSWYQCLASIGNCFLISYSVYVDYYICISNYLAFLSNYSLLSCHTCCILRLASR